MLCSLPVYFLYALNSTFIEPTFYSEKITEGTYDFLIRTSTESLLDNSEVLKSNFSYTELRKEIEDVFSVGVFKQLMHDFADQIQLIRDGSEKPFTISLGVFRQSLLTVSSNLAYEVYKKLPQCTAGESTTSSASTELKTDEDIPTCIPKGMDYDLAIKPFTKSLELSVYKAIPEEIKFDPNIEKGSENSSLYFFIKNFNSIRLGALAVMIGLLGLIALLVYKPFKAILFYEAIAFILASVIGFLLSFNFGIFLKQISNISQTKDSNQAQYFIDFLNYIFNFYVVEIQKLALIFLVIAGTLLLLRAFLKKNIE